MSSKQTEQAQVSLQDIRQISYTLEELRKISRKLYKLDEDACNYGLTPRQDKRVKTLMQEAEGLAQRLGYHAYHQGDPRGASLYLVDDTMDDTNYSNGVCL